MWNIHCLSLEIWPTKQLKIVHLLPLFELIAVEAVEEKGEEEVEHHEVANLGSSQLSCESGIWKVKVGVEIEKW